MKKMALLLAALLLLSSLAGCEKAAKARRRWNPYP